LRKARLQDAVNAIASPQSGTFSGKELRQYPAVGQTTKPPDTLTIAA